MHAPLELFPPARNHAGHDAEIAAMAITEQTSVPHALARFLTEFSAPPPPEETFEQTDFEMPELEMPESEPTIVLTVADFEQRLADAREQAVAEARAEVETELTTRFETERAELTIGFEAEREAWANEQGQHINSTLTESMAQLETDLSAALAQALRPLFSDACQARLITELGTALSSILADPSHPPLRIAGPVDLLTAFGNAHAGDIAIDYVVADQAELTIITESTRIETRLTACLAGFQISEE